MRRFSIGSFVSLLAAMLLSSATYAATPKIGHTAGGKKAVSLKSAGAPKIISARKKLRANKIVLSKRKLGLHRAAYASALSGVPPMLTAGDLAGLSLTRDPLDLKSNVALVLDQSTNEILFEKNAEVALWWKGSSKSNTSSFHSMMFEDNVGEDGLSAQSSYIINISDSNYIENLAPDPDMFDNEIVLEHDTLQKVCTKLIEALNEVQIKKLDFRNYVC